MILAVIVSNVPTVGGGGEGQSDKGESHEKQGEWGGSGWLNDTMEYDGTTEGTTQWKQDADESH